MAHNQGEPKAMVDTLNPTDFLPWHHRLLDEKIGQAFQEAIPNDSPPDRYAIEQLIEFVYAHRALCKAHGQPKLASHSLTAG